MRKPMTKKLTSWPPAWLIRICSSTVFVTFENRNNRGALRKRPLLPVKRTLDFALEGNVAFGLVWCLLASVPNLAIVNIFEHVDFAESPVVDVSLPSQDSEVLHKFSCLPRFPLTRDTSHIQISLLPCLAMTSGAGA